jgi:hypothetical protein
MDKKVAIGLCLVGSLVVTLSAPAYANQGGPGATGNGSGAQGAPAPTPAPTGNTNNTGNGGNTNTGNNNGGGTFTVQTPTVQTPTNGNNGNKDNAECSAFEFLSSIVLGQNSGNKACEKTVALFLAGGEYFAGRQRKGGDESSNQKALDQLGQLGEKLDEIIKKLTNPSSGQNPFGSPEGLYRNPYPNGPMGLEQLTGLGGNPLSWLSQLAQMLSWLSQLPQMFSGSPFGSSFNPVNTYYQDYLNRVAGAVQVERTRAIQDLATKGLEVARGTADKVDGIARTAEEKSQEGISKLKEFSQQDAGGQEAQNELQALRTLIKLTESGNKIKSTGFQTLNEGIQAGNQINAQGHTATAQLLTQILAAQKLSAEAQTAANLQQAQIGNQGNHLFHNAFNSPSKASTAALNLSHFYSGGLAGQPVQFNFRNLRNFSF